MCKIITKKLTLTLAAAGTAMLAACASVDTGTAWNILPVGSTWQVEQRNTGSYGRDVTFTVTRGESVWKGNPAVTFANSTGGTAMLTPNGKWIGFLGRDGEPQVTWDPPVGWVYPLSVGQSWSTQHTVSHSRGPHNISYACKVEGREPVTVRAGTFETLKIVRQSPIYFEVAWTIISMGLVAKQESRRLDGHWAGAGTQRIELLAVNRR